MNGVSILDGHRSPPCYFDYRTVYPGNNRSITTLKEFREALYRSSYGKIVMISFAGTELRNPLVKSIMRSKCLFKWRGKNPNSGNEVCMMLFEVPDAYRKE